MGVRWKNFQNRIGKILEEKRCVGILVWCWRSLWFGEGWVFPFVSLGLIFKLRSGKLTSSITGIRNIASAELLIAIQLVHRQADI